MKLGLITGTILVSDPVLIFFIVLAIILLAPVLLNRLKIPHIIGLIVAGVIVGPYGVGLLARDASFEIFGAVGILYLMFLAGIEIDMYHLKKNLNRGLGFGLYTFFVPMILGTLTSYYFLHFNWLTSVLLASMYASHTLVAYPIVSRFGLTKSPAVIIAIAGTIITVLGALIVLAVCVGIHVEGAFSAADMLLLLLKLVVYCIAIVYSFPRVTRWFFKKYSDNITQFVYILAMVFFASYTAKIIGLESVLGAFFAGLVLNRYIPNRSSLMNRIEFVGNAIFIPYFLIGVGMLINVKVVVSGWETLYVAAMMSVVATVCKWIAAWLTQLTYKMPRVDRSMMFGLSNAQAAATLAAVMIGFNLHIFNEAVLNGTIVMILITCTISSVITEHAAAKMKMGLLQDEVDEKSKVQRYAKNTLIPVSNPLTVASLVDLAILMQNPYTRGNRLYALHVRNDNSASARAMGQGALEIASNTAASVDASLTPIERYDMNFVTGVINTVEERDINEVILGMHRRSNVIDSFFGSKIEQLLGRTHKMVLISRCFIPVSTITRIVVYVPDKAQYESGFAAWIMSLGNLTRQLGCRIIFMCNPEVQNYIRGVIHQERYDIRHEYRHMEDWDDFVLLANRILDDDLFVVVSARKSSLSFDAAMEELPIFLQKYFSRNNLVVLYPEQSGTEIQSESFVAPLSGELSASPSEIWIRLSAYYRKLIKFRKRFTQRNRTRKIDL